MKIYTRTGDKGKTSLIGGKRVFKSSPRVDAYGTIDELNSVLGVVIATLSTEHQEVKHELEKIQHDLFAVGSYLADPSAQPLSQLPERVEHCERLIDKQMKELPLLRNFILPGGGQGGALIHQARTVCRRAERQIVSILAIEAIDGELVKYINRLSDLLFSTARFINHKEKRKEIIWQP